MPLRIDRRQSRLDLTNAIKKIYPDATVAGVSEAQGPAPSLPRTRVLFGLTAPRSSVGAENTARSDAISEGRTAFASSLDIKSVPLGLGGLFVFALASSSSYYRPLIAIPTVAITNIRIKNHDGEDETSIYPTFTESKNGIGYTVYVRDLPLIGGRTLEWVVLNYS